MTRILFAAKDTRIDAFAFNKLHCKKSLQDPSNRIRKKKKNPCQKFDTSNTVRKKIPQGGS